ncbi:winged helix-turn-helix transcriptional regulator [Actinacidiphila sp. DG2A-62]|uniref:winged helix-turn-helix transcriptional regulator n=1 Tax=Actinacidiphila sp. DG2A-62 TaxID=3108821 RepID=UPI002DB66B71|nr:winged helix-turn-helix transcriptional regulator [Actinacidiphila sp. DG2A-62]MEC3997180.1 winged helix-turn-helix transcriptional regulator [Actinacidiphila sp. DG2A-62]
MTDTGLSRAAAADLTRVTQALEMLAPRWSVWTLMTLSDQPLRYTSIGPRLALLADSQLSMRLKKLVSDGLVDRVAVTSRNVSYCLTERGQALAPVVSELARWGDTRLEKRKVPSTIPGMWEPERIPAAQNAEDTLALITARSAAAALWGLRAGGTSTATDLASRLPGALTATRLYPVLHQLVDDGLVERTGSRGFGLTDHGRSLAPVFRALSAWAAGRPASAARRHPIWAAGEQREPMLRLAAPRRAVETTPAGVLPPALSTAPGTVSPPRWRPGDLFSHSASPLVGAGATGGRSR